MSAPIQHALAGFAPRPAAQQAILAKLFAKIGEVSTLPTAAARIIDVAGDDNSSAQDLLRLIESDPAVSVRVLRTVNSAFYSLRNQVTNLHSAITLLGFREVRNLALTAHLARLFRVTAGYRTYSRQGLWDHLVGVATAARLIAKTSRGAPPDDAYLAGLVHDIGLLLIDQQIHKRFRQIVDALDESTPTCQIEQQLLTFDHAELGAYVAAQWQFAPPLVDAIRYHHAPQLYAGEHSNLVNVVALANYLCSRKGLTSLGVCNATPLADSVFQSLNFERSGLAQIWDQLEDALAHASELVVTG